MSDLSNKDIARLVAVKAKPVFDQEGWTWCDTKGKPPTTERIEDTVEYLLNSIDETALENGDETSRATGRFEVQRCRDEYGTETNVFLGLYWDVED